MIHRRSVLLIALAAGLVTSGGCNRNETKELPTNRLRILATTDEHSHVLAVQPERDEWPLPSATTVRDGSLKGGIARRATVLERERADQLPTVLLSNGDYSQGTLSAAPYTLANFDAMLMRQLGYDAVAMGNHELDFGPTAAAGAIVNTVGGAPPFVLTNALTTTGTAFDEAGTLYGGVGSGRPVVKGLVVEKGGFKVGVVSAIGPSAAFDVQHQAAPLTFSDASLTFTPTYQYPQYVVAAAASIAGILNPVVADLRTNRGAQVVVLLFHGGLQSTGTNGDVDLVIPQLRGVDLVVTGHTHGVSPTGVERIADADTKQVPVMQPAAYGNQLIRAEFVIENGQATFDGGRAAFLNVDDSIPPTSDQEVRYGISTALSAVEANVLGPTLTAVTGGAVVDDPLVVGDLYFYPLGTTTYDVTGAVLPRETNALNLDTDAMLAVTKGVGYPTVQVALQNAGSIRGDLIAGDTGTIGFSDVFRMASLGADPHELSPGFPLVHVYLPAAGLRGAFEQTLGMAYLNNDYYLGSAGVAVEWDPTRPTWVATDPAGPGWTTRFALTDGVTETVYYDLALNPVSGWLDAAYPTTLVHVVTPYLVAAFAGSMNVPLFAGDGTQITDLLDPAQFAKVAVEWTPGGPNVKDHQALARYIRGLCLANGGELPLLYNQTAPTRVVCTVAGCP